MRFAITIEKISRLSQYLFWTIAVFAYYFQVPYSKFSSLIIPMLGVYLLLGIQHISKWKTNILRLYAFYSCFLAISSVISLISGVEISRIIRFFIILTVIPLCFFFKQKNFEVEYKILLLLSVAKSIYLILIAIEMVRTGSYTEQRLWANENSFGDAYMLYGFLPRVQLHGNSLLLVAFIAEFERKKKFTVLNSIILFGVLIAGNFSFILALAIYFFNVMYKVIVYGRNKLIRIFLLQLLVVAAVFVLFYSYTELYRKSGPDGSSAFRIRQIVMLLDTNPVFGKGLGQYVYGNVNFGRSADALYFELQTMYIFYQIGILGLSLYYCITLSLCKAYGNRIFFLYFVYLIYSFFNPYCFDTTNMFSIIILINLQRLEGKRWENVKHKKMLQRYMV